MTETRVDTTKTDDENEGLDRIVNGKVQQPPEPAFKRLHLLYILHDVLMHQHSHRHLRYGNEETSEQIAVLVGRLAELTVCGCGGKTSQYLPGQS